MSDTAKTTYTCAQCNGVFERGWTDEEAKAEQAENGWQDEDCAMVCDDCYKAIISDPALAFNK